MGWRTFAGVGALLASAAATAACGVEKPAGGKPPAIVLEDVTLRHYADDGTVRTGHAIEVTYFRKEGRLEGKSIVVDVPPTENLKRGGVRLTAAEGAGDLKGNDAKLFGGVTVRTGAGDYGTTEAADYDGATETIQGDTPIAVKGPGYTTDADGFSFAIPGQKLDLKGNVQIHTAPEPQREEVQE